MGRIPYLFRNQADPLGNFLKHVEIGIRVMASGQFVVTAFAGQQWPRSSHTPSLVRAAPGALAVAVVVVPAPARTRWRFDLQHRIDHAQRISDDRVVGPANSVADQFEEAGVDDLFGWELIQFPKPLVCQDQRPAVRILMRAGRTVTRIDADVVAGYARNQSALRGDSPAFDVRFQKIGVIRTNSGVTSSPRVFWLLSCSR
jgi:hypothetical protein